MERRKQKKINSESIHHHRNRGKKQSEKQGAFTIETSDDEFVQEVAMKRGSKRSTPKPVSDVVIKVSKLD